MSNAVVSAFKNKQLRKKLLFTTLILIVVRFGSQLPIPEIDSAQISAYLKSTLGDSFSLLNSFTGGSFMQMSVFALSVTPYITSSIIMQLMTIVIPALEEMQKDGEDGRKKIVAITRYLTVGLALMESTAMAVGFGRQGLLKEFNFVNAAIVVLTLTAGSTFLMWIGERITQNGVGNGISIVLMINILSSIPSDITGLFEMFVKGKTLAHGALAALIIIAVILVTIVLVIVLNDATRKIPVQYAKKVQGRKMVGGQSTFIPLKVNTAGVIPVIFAQSILQIPIIISQLTGYKGTGPWAYILRGLNSSYWCKPSELVYSIGLIVYIVMVIFFAYFYTSITFNPLEIADNMKKQGGFIPGIRPGKPTSDYLNRILNYLIFIGACGLTIVCVLPYVFNGVFGASVSFGGTSLIIIVSVLLETLKQIESQMMVRNYKGFLND